MGFNVTGVRPVNDKMTSMLDHYVNDGYGVREHYPDVVAKHDSMGLSLI